MINLFVKGFLIGLGKIIPGVSGSIMAISFGIYDKVLDIISNFKIKKNIKFLFPLCLGFIISIVISSNFLGVLINRHYVIMMFLFIGLILGSFPSLLKEFKFSISNIIIFIISFVLIIFISLVKISNTNDYSPISFTLIGFLEAFTTIVPGISGTAIMMLIGCYNKVIEMFSNLFLLSNFKYLFPFLIGILIGIIIVSKLINYLLKKYKSKIFSSIIGFMTASIILLVIQTIPNISNILEVLIGLILMFFGIKMSSILS